MPHDAAGSDRWRSEATRRAADGTAGSADEAAATRQEPAGNFSGSGTNRQDSPASVSQPHLGNLAAADRGTEQSAQVANTDEEEQEGGALFEIALSYFAKLGGPSLES